MTKFHPYFPSPNFLTTLSAHPALFQIIRRIIKIMPKTKNAIDHNNIPSIKKSTMPKKIPDTATIAINA